MKPGQVHAELLQQHPERLQQRARKHLAIGLSMLTSMDEVPEARSPVVPVAVREHVEVVHLTKGLLCAWAGLKQQTGSAS